MSVINLKDLFGDRFRVTEVRPCSLVGAAEFLREYDKIPDEKGIRLHDLATGEVDVSPPLTPERKKELAMKRSIETHVREQAEKRRRERRHKRYYDHVNV